MKNKFILRPPTEVDQFIINYAKQNIPEKKSKTSLFMRYAAIISFLLGVTFILKPTEKLVNSQQQIVELTQPAIDSIVLDEHNEINNELLTLELELSFSEESTLLTNNM